MSGALDRYPGIEFILAYSGGTLHVIVYRVLLTQMRIESKISQARTTMSRKIAYREPTGPHRTALPGRHGDPRDPSALPSVLATMDPGEVR